MRTEFRSTSCACDHDERETIFGDEIPEHLSAVGGPMFVVNPSLILRRTLSLFDWHCGKRMLRVKQVRKFQCRYCGKQRTLDYMDRFADPWPVATCVVCSQPEYAYPVRPNWGGGGW